MNLLEIAVTIEEIEVEIVKEATITVVTTVTKEDEVAAVVVEDNSVVAILRDEKLNIESLLKI